MSSVLPFDQPRLRMALATIGLLVVAAGCDVIVEEEVCAGYPEVLYPIPDVSLVAGAELYVRDLEAHPRVFDHTHAARLYYDVFTSDRNVALADVDRGVLTVEGLEPGISEIRIDAIDACDTYTTTTFLVEVIPYGAAAKRQ